MLLEVKNLKIQFRIHEEIVNAVDGIDFEVDYGEVVAIIGESGSGKSVASLSLMGLLPEPLGKVIDGEIVFKGEDLLKKSKKQMKEIRGNKISMIFQEPMLSLTPEDTIGKQISETLIRHHNMKREDALKETIKLLTLVGIPFAEKLIEEYPLQASAEMLQRVMIVMALACKPELLIADEPTTALDFPMQAEILDLMLCLRRDYNTSILLVTQDLVVAAENADRVVVMQGGKIVEAGTVGQLFKEPLHPYTEGLLRFISKLEQEDEKLFMYSDNETNVSKGCTFSTRCSRCMEQCRIEKPALKEVKSGQQVACHLWG